MQNSQEILPLGWEAFDEKYKRQQQETQVRQIVEEKRRAGRTYTVGRGLLGAGAVLFLITGALAFLHQSQALAQNAQRISALTAQYEGLVLENDDLERQIEAGIDYASILDRAVREFGMTYPENSQVVGFEKGETPYVRQEESIP